LIAAAVPLFRNKKNIISISGIKDLARKYDKFPKFDAPAKFVEFTVANIVIIILSHFFAKSEVGCYSMCMQFILLPITVIGSAVGNVYYREISEQNSPIQVKTSTIKVAKINLLLSIVPVLFLSLGGDKLLVLFLGSKWENAGIMAIIMGIFSLPVILSEPLLPAFRALDKQEYRLRLNIINLLFSVGALLIASFASGKIYITLLIYSIVYSIVRFFFFFTVLKLTEVKIGDISKWFVPIITSVYIIVTIRLVSSGL
jgi:O-antigen/teichoic acid export membrane protein